MVLLPPRSMRIRSTSSSSSRERTDMGRTVSAETRAKMSAAKKGRVFSPEHRAKLSAAAKARQARIRLLRSAVIIH
ncbi:NUMOD3 domain-containing DNA-binding protein [Paraburkholderia sp. IW21]|uniref:NUMOD3 domain-containing DNA-binding protein n=1 Tax=Paraburkholderia sp. IW21 TaxID=3242488 RepID=UPI003520825F